MVPQLWRVTGAKTETCQVYEREIEASGASQWPRCSQPTRSFRVWIPSFFSFVPWKHMWRAELRFIKKSFLPCLLTLHHNHYRAICISYVYSITYNRQLVSILQLPLLPLSSQQLAFIGIVPVWCPGWHLFWIVAAHVIRVIRYFKCLCAWQQPSLPPTSPLYSRLLLHMLPVIVPQNASSSWIWLYSTEPGPGLTLLIKLWHFSLAFQTSWSFRSWLWFTFSSLSFLWLLDLILFTWPLL